MSAKFFDTVQTRPAADHATSYRMTAIHDFTHHYMCWYKVVVATLAIAKFYRYQLHASVCCGRNTSSSVHHRVLLLHLEAPVLIERQQLGRRLRH